MKFLAMPPPSLPVIRLGYPSRYILLLYKHPSRATRLFIIFTQIVTDYV